MYGMQRRTTRGIGDGGGKGGRGEWNVRIRSEGAGRGVKRSSIVELMGKCFFFSSRRRHTRLQGDWSSDVCSSDLEDILAVADEHLVQAMRFYAERKKIVVEPTGALSLAGALHGGVALSGARVGILISGGNVDPARYARLLHD